MTSDKKSNFGIEKYFSAIAVIGFSALGLCSIALLFAPSCMIAKMTGWTFLGISKDGWEGLSMWFGLLAVTAGVVYLLFHFPVIAKFLKGGRISLPREWVVGIILCAVLTVGVVAEIKPFSSFHEWHESHKHQLSNGQQMGLGCGSSCSSGSSCSNGSSCSSRSSSSCGKTSKSGCGGSSSHRQGNEKAGGAGCGGCEKSQGQSS